MAESSNVRLVRCPKCENLLPELPGYSVYQCGGCGAVLRAKKVNPEEVTECQRSDEEEKVGLVSGKNDSLLGKAEEDSVGKGLVSGVENVEARVTDSEGSTENVKNDSKQEAGKSGVEDGDSSKIELGDVNLETNVDKLETRVEDVNVSKRSSRVFERKLSDRGDEGRFGRVKRGYLEGIRHSTSNQVGEGTSKYSLNSRYRSEVNPDREELLMKLDELKEQLSRVQNVNENSREKVPLEHNGIPYGEPYVERDVYFQDHPSNVHRVSRQFSASNKRAVGAPYYDHCCDPYPNYRNLNPSYGDPFESQMFRRPPPRRNATHLHHMIPEPDPFDHHPYNMELHHLSCSCYQCYDRQSHIPSQIPPPSTFRHTRFPPTGSRMFNPQPHMRWPNELNLEMGSFPRGRPQMVHLPNARRCSPVVGGAPFITCHNCFELLKLTKNMISEKGEGKVSCGACSSVVSFAIVDDKLVSIDPNEAGHVHMKRDSASFCSEDYANSVYDFQAMDREREPILSSTGRGVSSSKSEEMHNLHSLSGTTSEDEHFSDEPLEKEATSLPGSPFQDPFDYSSKFRAVNRCGKGNLSSRSDQDRVITNKSTVRQNSLKETLATEIDISLKDYANNGVLPQDSMDVYQEDDQPKAKKGVDAFLAGIIKKSFRDFSKSNPTIQSGKRNVTINGHVLPDRLVKKAEKLAGPIYPGQYWYDCRAGFWGLMGGPCLGIIPPCIEEFNYPMPEKCAAGNTGVFVNGRELNQKDFDLLVTRGLPPSRNKSYIIEISGRVVDENSGLELDGLGKLAPTVEKAKHGFGMRAPKATAA